MTWRAAYPWTPKRLKVNGGELSYLDEGSGPVVVAVHGNPTWSFYWRRLVSDLSATHRVVVPDHIGCGLSDKPQDWPYRLADHVANLETLVASLGLRNITLVVHDWGGAIGSGYAVKHVSNVSRMIVTNTAAWPSTRIPLRIALCRLPGIGKIAVQGFNGFAGAAVFMASERGLDAVAKAGLLAPYDTWATRIATHRFVSDIPMEQNHPSRPVLQGIADGLVGLSDVPMDLIWGMKDWCFTPAFLREWEQRFPKARVQRLSNVGHYVMEDAPETVVAAVRSGVGVPAAN